MLKRDNGADSPTPLKPVSRSLNSIKKIERCVKTLRDVLAGFTNARVCWVIVKAYILIEESNYEKYDYQ
jgi:hypothetical protein